MKANVKGGLIRRSDATPKYVNIKKANCLFF